MAHQYAAVSGPTDVTVYRQTFMASEQRASGQRPGLPLLVDWSWSGWAR